ncbi:hypothetical protein AAFF_G00152480 [Aldrovandia affinis]|uniref:Uncharacterized protein n=1 Tax=Aldrovandia affinis TaxID=143900 RepID=A0AAD7W897_9TELE|nr:hypothetical protein AAFF_G00152480 [Aldrovandia affinis]
MEREAGDLEHLQSNKTTALPMYIGSPSTAMAATAKTGTDWARFPHLREKRVDVSHRRCCEFWGGPRESS